MYRRKYRVRFLCLNLSALLPAQNMSAGGRTDVNGKTVHDEASYFPNFRRKYAGAQLQAWQ